MSASQQAIAEELGLSIATVSRSLRNHKGINPQTRAKVLKTASKLGYRLNSIRTTSGQKDPMVTIGVLVYGDASVTGASAVVTTRILEGIAEEARRVDAALQLDYIPLALSHRIDEKEVQPVGLRNRLWQGSILVGHFGKEAVARFAQENICVQVADYEPGIRVDCVDHDDADSCELLVNHLWQQGHRQIGYLANSAYAACRFSRYAGICGSLARRGVMVDHANILNLTGENLSPEEAVVCVKQRLETGVSAWICENDFIGYKLIEQLRHLGLDCPGDLSICGFDNLEPPSGLPKLTSIDAPFEEMGTMAVHRLMQRLNRDSLDVMHKMLTCRLINGESVKGASS